MAEDSAPFDEQLPCPRCGTTMRPGFFLCMSCADAVPDATVEEIGAAVDGGLAVDQIATEFDLTAGG